MPESPELLLRDLVLIDPTAPTDDRPHRVTIRRGRIAEVIPEHPGEPAAPRGTARRFALPGLVNCHDHLYSHELRYPLAGMDLAQMRKWLDMRDPIETVVRMAGTAWEELRHGILLIRDLGAVHGVNTTLSRLMNEGLLLGPEVVASGRPIVMTGGHVWTFGREADGADECRKAVREQAKAGARVIKIMGSGGLSRYPEEDFHIRQFSDDELRATIEEAHAHGLPTCAHVFGSDAVARVVDFGIDSVEHGVEISDATLDTMVKRDISYVPTMTNMERVASEDLNAHAGRAGRAEEMMKGVVLPQRSTFQRALAAGVRIGVGTDSTGDYQAELMRMSALGMSNDGVIAAATVNGYRICGRDRPAFTVGARANFVIFDSDPRADVSALATPAVVVRNGFVVPEVLPWS